MDDESKDPFRQEKIKNIILCSKCSFPNIISDTSCMFCSYPLNHTYKATLKDKVSLYFKQRQWRKKKEEKARKLGIFFLGFILTLAGAGLFLFGAVYKNFKIFLISIVFLSYGIYTIRLIKNKRD